jgi:hypothetical protein
MIEGQAANGLNELVAGNPDLSTIERSNPIQVNVFIDVPTNPFSHSVQHVRA